MTLCIVFLFACLFSLSLSLFLLSFLFFLPSFFLCRVLLQFLIIGFLVFNLVNQFKPLDQHSQYVGSLVIRVTELALPIWFCCSLWNCKQLVIISWEGGKKGREEGGGVSYVLVYICH